MGENDPRVYFAAERTLLAWVRTAIAVIGLGFVVARFGLFLRVVAAGGGHSAEPPRASTAIGVGLVLFGAAVAAVAAVQHVRFCNTLPPADQPRRYLNWFAPAAGFALAAVAAILAVYLVASP